MAIRVSVLIFQLSVIFAPARLACSPAPSSSLVPGSNQTRKAEQVTPAMDKTLIAQVRKFAGDEGPAGREAWKTLNTYPRQELISSLVRIQRATPEGDSLQADIAFVLCNLGHEYQANSQIIVSVFTKTNHHALGEERLISRLIDRGGHDLLPILFSAVRTSDGALSGGLSDTFAEQMRSDPEKFLLKLKAEPLETRQKVYGLLDETVMSEEDVEEAKKYLVSVPRDAAVAPVAREMLKALSARQQE